MPHFILFFLSVRNDNRFCRGPTAKIVAACFFVLAVFSLPLNAQEAPQLIMEQKRAVAVSFAINGNPDSWRVFKENGRQPILGNIELRDDTIVFRPAISFQPGIPYVIKRDSKTIYTFSPSDTQQTQPVAEHIYPTSNTLPANLLKFYIRFSEPMAEGDPYSSIHLINASGDTLKEAFLKQLPALWNRDRTVLSLWLDPGRIKRDLNLNRKLGMPLAESNSYRLVIDSTLKSSHGLPLQSGVQREFSAVPADRKKPDTESWNIDFPEGETIQPLVVYFNEAMDYLSTHDRIEISLEGEPVKGTSSFSNQEKVWIFTPAEAWKGGRYILRADARIEDLAGNNLNRLFDRDINKQSRGEKEFYTIGFNIQ